MMGRTTISRTMLHPSPPWPEAEDGYGGDLANRGRHSDQLAAVVENAF
jgi:hypothetical protein